MRRPLLFALATLLAAPTSASAAAFGTLPFRPVQGVATCVRATGAPGELSRWTRSGAELLNAGTLAATEEIGLGGTDLCPQVVSQPNGAAVAAAVARRRTTTVVRVALREPGGRFGAPVPLTVPGAAKLDPIGFAVAVSPRGDAVVAVDRSSLSSGRHTVLAFRRPAGGAFLPAQRIASGRYDIPLGTIAAGADGAGRLTLAWLEGAPRANTAVETASAPPGGAFGAPQRVGPGSFGGFPALAVAPDGRALLAYSSDRSAVTVAERAPGAASFGAPASVAPDAADPIGSPSVALADGGAAVVAWRPLQTALFGVHVASRPAAGAFGPARIADAGTQPPNSFGGSFSLISTVGGPPIDATGPRAALTAAGFAIAWADDAARGGSGAAKVATGALAGGPVTSTALAAPVLAAASVAPFALPDGRAAVAWAEDAAIYGDLPTGKGRLHVAIAGVPAAADAPPPEATVAPLAHQRLFADDPLALPVRCAAACDVRASLGSKAEPSVSAGSLGHAGTLTLRIHLMGDGLGARDARSVRVTVRTAAPGSRATAVQHVRVPFTLRPSPPVPKPLGVRVRRDGDDLVVRWRTSFGAHHVGYLVSAVQGRALPVATAYRRALGRRSFSVRLRGAAHATKVVVTATGASDLRPRTTTVRVR